MYVLSPVPLLRAYLNQRPFVHVASMYKGWLEIATCVGYCFGLSVSYCNSTRSLGFGNVPMMHYKTRILRLATTSGEIR